MNVLVTAGNTQVLIDRVRCLTNIFTGRTGAALALEAYRRGYRVTLLTSHPEAVRELHGAEAPVGERWHQFAYHTFDDLHQLMHAKIGASHQDAVIHAAAVSDYLPAGVFALAPGTSWDQSTCAWHAEAGQLPALADRSAGKIKSEEAELWLRLVRAPKLIDKVRTDWSFRGTLVKFKLEVGTDDERLLEIAERSRVQSGADLMVANTLEGAAHWAFLGPCAGQYVKVPRRELAAQLWDAVENLRHG